MDRTYINNYLDDVANKVSSYRDRFYIPGVRDDTFGFSYTADRLINGQKNLLFNELEGKAYDPVDAIFRGFSEAPGMNDVDNVKSVDAVDISIMATMQSIIPYIAAERAMQRPVDIIYYQKLVTSNAQGGFASGEDVVNPFRPLPNKIRLNKSSSTFNFDGVVNEGVVEAQALNAIAKRSVIVTITKGEGAEKVEATGRDKDGDGILYWTAGGLCTSGEVNYIDGEIKITGVVDDATVKVSGEYERTSEEKGEHTLKVKAVTERVTVEAETNRIILESSFEENAYMNKMTYDLQQVGISMDYGKRSLRQLLDGYVHFIDVLVVEQFAKTATSTESKRKAYFDMTAYSIASSQASTKNDKLNEFMLELDTGLLRQCGKAPTCYVVDTDGARILANNPYFTSNANFGNYLNGVVGTYKNVPVVRHNALDEVLNVGEAFIGVTHKTADGQAASVVFSEYLPPYSIRPALNYNNPSQFSTGLFSQNTAKEIVPTLAAYGVIKFAGSN